MILAVILVTLLFASDASCQTVVTTYSSKLSEEVLCPITDQTLTATWTDETTGITLVNYVKGKPNEIVDPGAKHNNFIYYVNDTSFSLFIQPVQAEDGGDYECNTVGDGGTRNEYTVVVEVLAKPTVKNGSQDVDVLDVIVGTPYDLTCSATGARSENDLSLMWDPPLVENNDLIVTPNVNFTDYSITSTYIAKKDDSTITCQLTGYVTQDEINDQLITDTVNLNVWYSPMCSLVIQEGEDCTEVTLTCECDAVPADITLYSFFNGSSLIHNGTIKTFTVSVAFGTSTEFSCSATNDIGPGDQTDPTVHNCDEAMVTTTEEPEDDNPENPGPSALGTGAIVGISLGVVAVVVVIIVVAVIMCKKGEDDSKPSDDKPNNNGAGPGVDPENPTYGTNDKNITKDQAPAPHSSMRDSTNSSKPKQDMEMQYADIDHGNKPPSDEVRKPNKEPTEYATVQPVIV